MSTKALTVAPDNNATMPWILVPNNKNCDRIPCNVLAVDAADRLSFLTDLSIRSVDLAADLPELVNRWKCLAKSPLIRATKSSTILESAIAYGVPRIARRISRASSNPNALVKSL